MLVVVGIAVTVIERSRHPVEPLRGFILATVTGTIGLLAGLLRPWRLGARALRRGIDA